VNLLNTRHEVFVVDGIGNGVLGASEARISEMRATRLSGWITAPEHVGPAETFEGSIGLPLAQGLRLAGEWVGQFSSDDGSLAIATDYFGYAQLFYTLVPDVNEPGRRSLVASLSFRGLLSTLRQMERRTALRTDILFPSVASHNNLFSTRWSSETLAEGIQVLPYGAFLVMNRRGFAVARRPETRGTTSDMADATAWSIGVLERAVAGPYPVQLSLSGGKDSRAVLALLLAGDLHKKVSVHTSKPSGTPNAASREILERDAGLAARLVARYGMSWQDRSALEEVVVGRDAYLDYWQDLRSGLNYEYKGYQSLILSPPTIEVTGLGGELYRSYIGSPYRVNHPGWWSAAGKTSATVRSDLAALFSAVCNDDLVEADLYTAARDAFVDALDLGQDGDVLAQIDRTYLEYRNRSHGSIVAFRSVQGQFPTHPLASPDLYDYSRRYAPADAESGRLLFDLIEHHAPELNSLEFASPPWPKEFSTSSSYEWSTVDAASVKSQLLSSADPRRSASGAGTGTDTLTERVFDSAHLLEAHGVEQGLLRRAARLAQRSPRLRWVVLTALESARDVLAGPSVDVDLRRTSVREQAGRGRPDAGTETVFAREWAASDLSDVDVVVSIDPAVDTTVHVRVSGMPTTCRAACYLHVDGKRVAIQWYQPEQLFTFVDVPSGTRVWAQVYLRWDDMHEAHRVVDTVLTAPGQDPAGDSPAHTAR
jgi:hypothetical protein